MDGRCRMGIGYRQQPHGMIHHLGMGVDLIISSVSGRLGNDGGTSAVHGQGVEIGYED